MEESLLVGSTVEQLFRASRYSLDPTTADFMLRRVIPITLFIDYVEGDVEGMFDVTEDFTAGIKETLANCGYPSIGEWGPFYGSHLITIFGKGDKPELGDPFVERIKSMGSQMYALKNKIPPETRERIYGCLVLGGHAIVFAAPVATAILPFTVPLVVFDCIASTVGAAEVIEAVRHVLRPGHG